MGLSKVQTKSLKHLIIIFFYKSDKTIFFNPSIYLLLKQFYIYILDDLVKVDFFYR